MAASGLLCASLLSPGGRPPWRPRARAAARPALVRSRVRSRSNSASEANRLGGGPNDGGKNFLSSKGRFGIYRYCK